MKKRKKRNPNNNLLLIVTIFIVVLTLILFILSKIEVNPDEELAKEGYETQDEDPFYKKIATNNTLDEYYNDVSQQKDSSYEEYYFSKESYDFIELKMVYKQKMNTTLNILSDLRTEEVQYNYELSYNKSYLIIEGNSNDNYNCNVVVNKNVKEETLQNICNNIMGEISIFLERRETLMQNKKIKEIVESPIKEYVEVEE